MRRCEHAVIISDLDERLNKSQNLMDHASRTIMEQVHSLLQLASWQFPMLNRCCCHCVPLWPFATNNTIRLQVTQNIDIATGGATSEVAVMPQAAGGATVKFLLCFPIFYLRFSWCTNLGKSSGNSCR